MKIAVFGGTGAGEIVVQVTGRFAKAGIAAIEFVGYLNDRLPAGETLLGGCVIGSFHSWASLPQDIQFLAPLHKATQMPARSALIEDFAIPYERWATLIDPDAIVAENATIAKGSVLGPFVVVGPSCSLGRHVACWPAAQLGHDVNVADFVFVGRASIVSGYCSLGLGAYVGAGATVRERCRIGKFAVIGAGAVVTADVPDFAVVAGNPARQIASTEIALSSQTPS
jgi:acetyltransferase EpsM